MEKDKSGIFMKRVKDLQIDRLRVIFNRLGATVESQQNAINSVLETLLKALHESQQMLTYTVYKVTNFIISDCQEEFFSETDQTHPTKIARLTCGLCDKMRTQSFLADTIKTSFYKACPLIIPKQAEPGIESNEFYMDMGFVQKNIKNSGQVLCIIELFLSCIDLIVI
jgi:hypothetical protein